MNAGAEATENLDATDGYGMLEQRFLTALRIIYAQLADTHAAWVITGSCGMALQGMDVAPHDIDLQSDRWGVYELERRLRDYVTEPVRYLESPRIRSHLGRVAIAGVKMDLMGDVQKLLADQSWEETIEIARFRHWIEFAGMKLPVFALDYEHQAYLKLGRPERAAQIRRWLENKSNHGADSRRRS